MTDVTHRTVETNGIRMHIAETGTGPLVLLCHGFPESWYSWRHQLRALAEAGYHAVAPDMRGYGQTDAPQAIDQYTLFHLAGDMVGLLDALGEAQAVIVGHDWGAPVAWHSALFRPDRFRAVVALSVPFRPRAPVRPTTVMPQTDAAVFYQLYFQTPGVAEAELESDPRAFLRGVLYGNSGDGPFGQYGLPADGVGMVPRDGGMRGRMSTLIVAAGDPAGLAYRGGCRFLHRRVQPHRVSRRAELVPQHRPQLGADGAVRRRTRVGAGALHDRGPATSTMGFRGAREVVANMAQHVPLLRETIMLPGCGHWTQQERPAEVNAAMIGFLRSL